MLRSFNLQLTLNPFLVFTIFIEPNKVRIEAFAPPAPPQTNKLDPLQMLPKQDYSSMKFSRRTVLTKSSLLLPLLTSQAAHADTPCMERCLKSCYDSHNRVLGL